MLIEGATAATAAAPAVAAATATAAAGVLYDAEDNAATEEEDGGEGGRSDSDGSRVDVGEDEGVFDDDGF